MRNFTFRKLTRDDLPLIRRWLATPHVKAWWPDLERHVGAMLNDMYSEQINMQMVCLIDHPFAYVQDYDAKAYGEMQYADLPPGARVMDTFVGDDGFVGQGHATAYIDAYVRELRRLYPIVAVGPNTKDTHTISTYHKAGFRNRRLAAASDGGLMQVMTHI